MEARVVVWAVKAQEVEKTLEAPAVAWEAGKLTPTQGAKEEADHPPGAQDPPQARQVPRAARGRRA